MDTLDTNGKILNMIKEHGVMRITVSGHAGYFNVPDKLEETIVAMFEKEGEISFNFDRDLNIVSLN